ncbi:hypothetical protein BGZ94_004381 [Podila epigama]|nr:hypothetical protein BGZ94_004381 [Podila epigama]
MSSDATFLDIIADELRGTAHTIQKADTTQKRRFHIQSFVTRPKADSTLFPGTTLFQSIHVKERLILVSVDTSDNSTDTEDNADVKEQVLVAGLEVLEYTVVPTQKPNSESPVLPQRIVYVAKVDTSGAWRLLDFKGCPMTNPTRALVHGYLKALRTIKVTAVLPGTSSQVVSYVPETTLHIFARDQPQYLFAKSAKNPGKQPLSDRGLVRWWKNRIELAYKTDATPEKSDHGVSKDNNEIVASTADDTRSISAWWHIPGISSERHALSLIQGNTQPSFIVSDTATKESFWKYGYYGQGDMKSGDVIPRFPDDPTSRMISSPSCGNGSVNVETFWELIAIGEECGAGKITGFFRVVEARTTPVDVDGLATSKVEKSKGLSSSSYTDMINTLLSLNFSTLSECIESTTAWNKHLKSSLAAGKTQEGSPAKAMLVQSHGGIQQMSFDVELSIDAKTTLASSATSTSASSLAAATGAAPALTASQVPVNVLGSSMIKRKVPTEPVAINVLGASLIKKKKTDESK